MKNLKNYKNRWHKITEDFKDYIKAYDGDKDTAKRVFDEISRYEQEVKSGDVVRIRYNQVHKKIKYAVELTKPRSMSISQYLAEYIFVTNADIGKYPYTMFIASNGSLIFINKKYLKYISNIEVYPTR